MIQCDESTAKLMSDALMDHAREIRRYARAYPKMIADMPGTRHKAMAAEFIKNVDRMVNGMYSLMLLAKYRGISRFCNHEQIEAHMMDAYSVIDAMRSGMVELVPALLN